MSFRRSLKPIAMSRAAPAGLVLVFLAALMFQTAAQSPDVYIDAVNPSRGSIAGGTRLHIQGRGFSTSTGVGNIVMIGPYTCDPIPLHSTASQIACKTQNAMTGMWDEWIGWTGPLEVVVIVAGKASTCSASQCTFEYHYGWYHTPRIYSLQPVAVKTGDLITVNGRFHPRPFDFELLNAPSQEVPLASVKIANRESEQQQPQNEPFGQSGTRCGLFNPAVEEPYGVTGTSEISQFLCAVNGPREGGRYNMSVALLGTGMVPDSQMNMGESQVQSSAFLVDHMAVSFMVHQTPCVFSVHPKASGILGGARVTIQGDAFSRTNDNVQVTIGSVQCRVIFSAIEQLICVLDDHASNTNAEGDLIPGDLGVRMKLWYNQGCETFENFRVSDAFFNETFVDADEVLFDRFETPRNLEAAFGLESGPVGRLQSFFRVPTSGKYSFIHATDDFAELYIGTGEHDLQKIIDSTVHVSFRDFSRTLQATRSWRLAGNRVNQHKTRMSAPIALQGGEYKFLEAWYRSCSGGDHFSLGAIFHDTHVNRKDHPFAIDEKQAIVVEAQPSFEVHNITLTGDSTGRFRLQLGSKLSRPIRLKADELEMAGAVRELLSNCAGSIGEVADAAGNALDCFQAHGIDYRGFVSTTVDGEQCKPWNETAYWDPVESIQHGLEGNFCRNPITDPSGYWERESLGPWCYNSNNQRKACIVPRCGGNETMASQIPLLATFEELEDGAEVQSWLPINGHRPTIDSSTAFCGHRSLHFENNGGRLWNLWKQDPTKGSAAYHWSQEWPWICMAYRIPPNSIVEMIINMELPWYNADGTRRWTVPTEDDPVSVERWRNLWTSITLTNMWTQWTKIGEWGVIADDQWHYACISVQDLLEQSGIGHFYPGSNVEIREIRFQGGEPGSTYSKHEFWIDEFSISKAPRSIARPGFPNLGGAHAKMVGVSREEVGDSVSWQVKVTPEDCRDELALDFDVIDPTDASWADAKRVKEHAPALGADLVVSFRGEFASFSPYATAEEVAEALESMPSIGTTSVTRAGTCQSGYSWVVSFTHIPGDVELLQISTESDLDVYVVDVEDGGLLMAPLSADYFHVPVNKSVAGVSIVVNNGTGWCLNEDACSFSFLDNLTPTVTSVSQEPHGAISGFFNLSIAGTGLSPIDVTDILGSVHVHVSGKVCKVTLVSDTLIECFLERPFIPAGLHPIAVTVEGRGRAHGNETFEYPLHVEAVSPSAFTLATPRSLSLTGYGFDPELGLNQVLVAGITCAAVSVSAQELQCLLRGSGVAPGLVSLEVLAGNSTFQSAALITFVEYSPPVIESVTPSYGTAGGGDRVVIRGSNFSGGQYDVAVTIGGAGCSVSESNDTVIVCATTAGPIGTQELVVDTAHNGEVSAPFEYVLEVSEVSPRFYGLGGGTVLEVEGRGFVSDSGAQGQPVLKVPGTEVYVVGLYAPALIPEVHEIALAANSVNEVQRVDAGSASFFALSVGGVQSEPFPANVDQYVMAAELNTLLSQGSVRARRMTSSSGGFTWLVEFFGDVGDVDLMGGATCSTDSAASCSPGGIAVLEVVKGQAPIGQFSLSTTAGGVVLVPAAATELEMEAAFLQLPVSGGVKVDRTRGSDGLSWKVTYVTFEGKRDLPMADSSGLGGTGTVTVRRLAEGTAAPAGEWQVSLGGKWTGALPANASEDLVRQEIKDSFPWLSNIDVIGATNLPGRFLNRAYPQQWAIRFSRQGVAGLGVDRCTNPLYVDWDPAACPSIAADLFLSHYPWYWPTRIPKPADQGTADAQEALQALCDQEAIARNLRPGFCQALVPLETLPVCGQGSGINPPCWSERFTTAKIRLLDGKQVLFQRDDSESPTDNTKGYRFWKRLDIAALEAANALAVNSTIAQLGAGVHVDRVFSRAEQRVQLETVETATFTKIKTKAPDMTPYLSSYAELVITDSLYTPVFSWRSGETDPLLIGRAPRVRYGTEQSCTDGGGSGRRLLTTTISSSSGSSSYAFSESGSSVSGSDSSTSSTSSYSFSGLSLSSDSMPSKMSSSYSTSDSGSAISLTSGSDSGSTWSNSGSSMPSTRMPSSSADSLSFTSVSASSSARDSLSFGSMSASSSAGDSALFSSMSATSSAGGSASFSSVSAISVYGDSLSFSSSSVSYSAANAAASMSSFSASDYLSSESVPRFSYSAGYGSAGGSGSPVYDCEDWEMWETETPASKPVMAGWQYGTVVEHSPEMNGDHFTVDLWFVLYENVPGIIVSSIQFDSHAGYALTFSGCKIEFILGRDSGSSSGFSVVSVDGPSLGQWVHVSASWDGQHQRLYTQGKLVNSTRLEGRFLKNTVDPVMIGASCDTGGGDRWCPGRRRWPARSPRDMEIADVLWYDKALSAGAIRGHAAAADVIVQADVVIEVKNVPAVCAGDCTASFSAGNTSLLSSISPASGFDGMRLKISGEGFLSSNTSSNTSCDLEVALGEHACEPVLVSDTWLECIVRVALSGSLAGPQLVTVSSKTYGRFLGGQPTFLFTSAITDLTPRSISLLGGANVHITGEGFPTVVSRVSVMVGSTPCAISSLNSDLIICAMGLRGELESENSLLVRVLVDDVDSSCDISDSAGCELGVESSATPALNHISSNEVEEGQSLVLSGAFPSDVPSISIGNAFCNVREHNATHIICSVGAGEGGLHFLLVRFNVGFALSDGINHPPELKYSLRVKTVLPSTGSVHGGQSVVVRGTGFSTVPNKNFVFVNGRKARVLSADRGELVVETRPQGPQEVGLEKSILSVVCGGPGQGSCDLSLQSCMQTIFGNSLQTSVKSKRLAVSPQEPLMQDIWLIDSDPNTIWRAPRDADEQLVALDLGMRRKVSGVNLHWAGISCSEAVAISIGNDCQSMTEVANMTVESNVWDQVTALRLPNATDARFVFVTLRTRKENVQYFRIRDLVVEEALQESVSVMLDGFTSECSGSCQYVGDAYPELFMVSPDTGESGVVVNVTASGLNATDCGSNIISIGGGSCVAVSCSHSWQTCEVPVLPAGEHPVTLFVLGVGNAAKSSPVTFTQNLELVSVTPPEAGLGGGARLRLNGNGFASTATVRICNSECTIVEGNASSLHCTQGLALDVASTNDVGKNVFVVPILSGLDDVLEDVRSGHVSFGGTSIGFQITNFQAWSREKMFLRFAQLDIAQGRQIEEARLNIRAGPGLCAAGTKIRIWAEYADDSEKFQVVSRGSLGSRPVTTSYVDWVVDKSWKWAAEAIESVDLSPVLNEVIARPGWRSGGALTLVLQQEKGVFSFKTADQRKCSMLTAEYGGEFYAPKLRIELSTTSALSLPADLDCAITVTVATTRSSESCDATPLRPVSAVASSESKLEYGKMVWEKEGNYLLHRDAVDFCTVMGVQLCGYSEIFDLGTEEKRPFFYDRLPGDGLVSWVPTFHLASDGMQHYEKWMSVSSDLTNDEAVVWWPDFGGENADNEVQTRFLPCCGNFEYTARMAIDGDHNTLWKSANSDSMTLTLDFGENMARISHLELRWASGWATSYGVLGSVDGNSWSLLHSEQSGDGALDDISLVGTEHHNAVLRYLRIAMSEFGGTGGQYSLTEVIPYGCSLEPQYTTVVEGANGDATLFTAMQALTPMVWSVTPSRGTTAGGSTVTIQGTFFSDQAADLSVQFGDFECGISSVQSSGDGVQTIECLTSASGVTNGGKKYVVVTAKDLGSSFPMANATFWYIDAWSARTTWGGGSPPVGCGSWEDDPDCTDTVVIPEGQVVLLDVSIRRFYLILIEGTLMFDRANIELSANYILIRGGTLQIGTELEPFMQQAKITMYGHPKSIDLPTFGAKVIACYECTLDIHGAPQVAWTTLNATVYPGDTEIFLNQPVQWPVGSKIVIATTDFESPRSSHSEVATVVSLADGGRRVAVADVGVCNEYSFNGLPTRCTRRDNFTFTHLGETRVLDGRIIHFRAEVGLLTRNILIEGDADKRLCPLAETAEDHVTLLSCVQFGAQIFLHSPGHESLVARLSNFEIRNAGQAFRLGRYAIHWHMIGNLRESFQRNCSIHHSWNRGTAIHGVHYLRMEHNFLYNIMGHTVFIEDGVEEYNQVIGNLGIKTIPSMSLLNTDQTPAVFWIVTGANYIIQNHAVASRRYGFWFRPEISATGTSANTPDVHPINIPLLEGGFDGNEAHSNGKYGLRIFDIYRPNEVSVFKNTFVWRNGAVGWTATVIGKVAFDGMIAIQNGHHVFEGRSTEVSSWDDSYIANSLFADYVDPPLPLETSYSATSDGFGDFEVRGGAMHLGILLPWNEAAGGGMSIRNCTFVNFKNPCIRGCAHCGRGGSPVLGDGAFETRFSGMRFVNSTERVLLRHPNEGFFYDLDGTLTGTGRKENYTQGGDYRGASFVGRSTLLPPGYCKDSNFSTHGTGGAICEGLVFRRMWYHIREPSEWVGKALCVRRPDQSIINTCQDLQPECNCLPHLKKAWSGNVWLAAEGYRYNVQMDLLPHEMADPDKWSFQVWDTQAMEDFYFSQRMLQWDIADKYGRPLYWSDAGGGYTLPDNYFVNQTACTYVGCGMVEERQDWTSVDYDVMGTYVNGSGLPGDVPISERDSQHRRWTVKTDADENGAIHTIHVRGRDRSASHRAVTVEIKSCPASGCWPPPPPPPRTGTITVANWSDVDTWRNLTDHPSNPLVRLEFSEQSNSDDLSAVVAKAPRWRSPLPGAGDDVWIPWWKTVILDVSTPLLGHLVIEGNLIVNASTSVNLSATWIEIKGGSLIIATTDEDANVVGPYTGTCYVKLFGTNPKLSAIHGSDPRETPELIIGREGVALGSGVLGVMGKLVAKGKPVSHNWVALAASAAAQDSSVLVEGEVDWEAGVEIVLSPSDFDMHEADVVRVTSVVWDNGNSILTLASPLQYPHFAGGTMQFGTRSIEVRSRVGLLTHNIVFSGSGEGEDTPYTSWNSQLPIDAADAVCPNSRCENGETSETCPQDCIGPAHEYGAGVLVAAYTEDYTSCTSDLVCTSGFRREFQGTADMSFVEFRYYGQNNLRPGVQFQYVHQGNTSLDSVSFNRGYFGAVWVDRASNVVVENSVFYRSHLPTLQVVGGSVSLDNIIERNLGVVGIFWNTHRGATQGKGLDRPKLEAMIGMFHDDGTATILNGNVAAGSERAGFTSPGVQCDDTVSFVGNEAHSCLAGFWFNQYRIRGRACTALTDFRAWKIYEYAVYGEVPSLTLLKIDGLATADARAGVNILMAGADALSHVRKDQRVLLTNSLIVGHSDNGNCLRKRPSLHTCAFYMAWCDHLPPQHSGVYISAFLSGPNMAPKIKPWFDGGAYAALFGQTDLDGVTFANFGQPCNTGPRAGRWDHAVTGVPPSAGMADGWHPLTLKNMELVNVAMEAKVLLQPPNPSWINQADCIDMDCDGPKHALVRDEDGTFLEESNGGTILPRAEMFSEGSFFLSPYKDDINIPNQEWWYPTVPSVMRTSKAGDLVNVSDVWTKRGFGHSRVGCSLIPEWNAWRCPTSTSYRRLVIESMDRDHEIRRISPVALSSSDGYTDLLNGCMDHGWCFSYTCLKRLMTFWGVVATGLEYTVHFAGSNPQTMRISLPYAAAGEKIILKIYYSTAQKMQIFVNGRYIEDINRDDGKEKTQLVRDGRWASNNVDGGYTTQYLSMGCSCLLGDECKAVDSASAFCQRRGDTHGANMWNRAEGLLEIVIEAHSMDRFIEIKTMPVMAVSMALSTTPEDFYKIKDAFLSNMATLLGIDVKRIAVVDVRAGNARRRRRLLSTEVDIPETGGHGRRLLQSSGTSVDVEISSDPEVYPEGEDVYEDGLNATVLVIRQTNIYDPVSVDYSTIDGIGLLGAIANVHYMPVSGTLEFAQYETEKSVAIPVLQVPGHATGPVSFRLTLSSPINATLTKTSARVRIYEVHSPAPQVPVSAAPATGTQLTVSWGGPVWTMAPNDTAYSDVIEYELRKKLFANGTVWETVTLDSATVTQQAVSDLPAFSSWLFSVRARTITGWTAWSVNSAILRTRAVCGDGKRQGIEGCDVGSVSGIGCVACVVVGNFSCSGKNPDVCTAGCGDGIRSSAEFCDDGNKRNNDGCSPACEIEPGWSCVAPFNTTTIECNTTCGDGIKAGDEECDAGDMNNMGHGCTGCVKEAGAMCVEDEDLRSSCKICGNMQREEDEECDDGGESGGCSGCSIVAGWRCVGGSLQARDRCYAGPSAPDTPVVDDVTEASIIFSWTPPAGNGLTIVDYYLEYFQYNSTNSFNATTAQATITLTGLQSATTYMMRVRARTAVAAGNFSSFSELVTTSAPPASNSLDNAATTISSDPLALVEGVTVGNQSIQLSGLELEAPPAEPEAPVDAPELTEDEYAAILAAANGSTAIEITGENPADEVTTEPAANSIFFGDADVGFSDQILNVNVNTNLQIIVRLSKQGDDTIQFGGSFLVLTADYASESVSAFSGQDFEDVSGTLVFQALEVENGFQVFIQPGRRDFKYPRVFRVVLVRAGVGGSGRRLLQSDAIALHDERWALNVTIQNPDQYVEVQGLLAFDNEVKLSNGQGFIVPGALLQAETLLSIERSVDLPPMPTGDLILVSDVLNLGPANLQFSEPVPLFIEMNAVVEGRINVLHYYNGSGDWIEQPLGRWNSLEGLKEDSVTRFGTYALFARPCPANTYQDRTQGQFCESCPQFSSSAAGSTTVENCTCAAGYIGDIYLGCFPLPSCDRSQENCTISASPGCPLASLGDQSCDIFCMTEEARFDNFDCFSLPGSRGRLLQALARADKDFNEVITFEEADALGRSWGVSIDQQKFNTYDVKAESPQGVAGLDWYEMGLLIQPVLALDDVSRTGTPGPTFMAESAIRILSLVDVDQNSMASQEEFNDLYVLTNESFRVIRSESESDLITMPQLMASLSDVALGLLCYEVESWMRLEASCKTAILVADYNHDEAVSVAEATILGFSQRMFTDIDINGDGLITSVELYNRIRANNDNGCKCRQHINSDNATVGFEAPVIRFADSPCTLLVMPEWNHEREETLYSRKGTTPRSKKHQSVRPPPPQLRKTGQPAVQTPAVRAELRKRKSAHKQRLSSPRATGRRLLNHVAVETDVPAPPEPNSTFPFLVSLQKPQMKCGIDHYLPEDTCETPPWLLWQDLQHLVTEPGGLSVYDMCLPDENFLEAAQTVSDGVPDFITEEDFEAIAFDDLEASFLRIDWAGSGLIFADGYTEFQEIAKFLFPTGVGSDVSVAHIQARARNDGNVYFVDTAISAYWWGILVTDSNSSSAENDRNPPWCNCTAICDAQGDTSAVGTPSPSNGTNFTQTNALNTTGCNCTCDSSVPAAPTSVDVQVIIDVVTQSPLVRDLTLLTREYLGCSAVNSSTPTRRRLLALPRNVPLEVEYGDWFHYCSGALVAPNRILTAAFCVGDDIADVLQYDRVRIGGNTTASGIDYRISRVHVHPLYTSIFHDSSTLREFDVAILELEMPVPQTDALPLRMYDGLDLGYKDCQKLMLQALGFGERRGATDVERLPNRECDAEKYEELGYAGSVTPPMLCTISSSVSDLQFLDVGSPVVATPSHLSKDEFALVGVVSVIETAHQRQIHTRITAVRQWVLAVLGRRPTKTLTLSFDAITLAGDSTMKVIGGVHTGGPRTPVLWEACDPKSATEKFTDAGLGGLVLEMHMPTEVGAKHSFSADLQSVGCGTACQRADTNPHIKCDSKSECRLCGLSLTWRQLTQLGPQGKAYYGGLGLEKDAPYSHWACVRDWDVEEQLACAARDGEYVCFKFNTKTQQFDYDNMNENLGVLSEAEMVTAKAAEIKGLATLLD